MKTLIIVAVTLGALVPGGLIVALGLRRQFENEVFGRIYVWDRPWRIVTQDDRVRRQYETLQRRMILLGGVLAIMFIGVVALVV